MTTIQSNLEKATQKVNEWLLDFKVGDIPEIADMIKAIETVGMYTQAFENVPEESEVEELSEIAEVYGIDYASLANEKLDDAEKYYQLWIDTTDEQFKQICSDDIRHSEMLMAKVKAENPDSPHLQELKTYHNALLARIV